MSILETFFFQANDMNDSNTQIFQYTLPPNFNLNINGMDENVVSRFAQSRYGKKPTIIFPQSQNHDKRAVKHLCFLYVLKFQLALNLQKHDKVVLNIVDP